MTKHQTSGMEITETAINESLETLWNIAQESKNNPLQLLEILRKLENLHQKIRDTVFQEALPDNRQALYVLLRDIEAKGGWPYIYRTKLSELMDHLTQDELEKLLPEERPPSSMP